jgi:hypothetical protein
MIDTSKPQFPANIQWAIRRLSLFNDGRRDAIQFAWDCEGKLAAIQQALQEKEQDLENVFLAQGPLKNHASPRFYHEGYIKGLKEVIEIIIQSMAEQ